MHHHSDRFAKLGPDGAAPGAGAPPSLTYEPFYALREKAFSLSADPRFLYRSPAHAPAFDDLLAGIRRREGLIVLTGEIGTGKTTLCRSVLEQLDRRTFAAFVADPFVSREDLLKMLLVQFGVLSIADLTRGRFNGASRSDLSYPLYEFLDSLVPLQAFAVVVIDEAQNLSLPLLEEIRILSELERREKLLQVVLVGQPELRASLKLPQMKQVDQRVSVRCELKALEADCVADYLGHRLRIAAGGPVRVELTRAAIQTIYDGSSGVPRLINRICDRAFQRAYASRSMLIDEPFVWGALDDLGLTLPLDAQHRSRQERPAEERPAMIPASPQAPASHLRVSAGPQATPTMGRAKKWITSAAAAALLVVASVGAPVWYAGASWGESGLATLPVAPPPPAVSLAVAAPSPPEDSLPEVAPAPVAPPSANGVAGAAGVASAGSVRYKIMVAAFKTGARAERLVEELTAVGYGAHAAPVDAGPARGRLVQVMISGYTSAIEVQRDLQRIRELPGGYTDARIIEQK